MPKLGLTKRIVRRPRGVKCSSCGANLGPRSKVWHIDAAATKTCAVCYESAINRTHEKHGKVCGVCQFAAETVADGGRVRCRISKAKDPQRRLRRLSATCKKWRLKSVEIC